MKIEHLCFCLGFFTLSGFSRLWGLIREHLAQLKCVRILVGMDIDARLSALNDEMLKNPHKKAEFFAHFTAAFCKAQATYIQTLPYDKDIESDFEALINAIASKQLEIRINPDKSIHAKFYVFSTTPSKPINTPTKPLSTNEVPRVNGSLILGSSNLSHNGLEAHYEFNLESNEIQAITRALQEFKELWDKASPLQESEKNVIKRAIEKDTYLAKRTPREIYYKLLIEELGVDSLRIDNSLNNYFPAGFKPLDYQKAAIKEGLNKLERYNGFFLSDVVGLGKTLIACIIAKILCDKNNDDFRVLIVCPTALEHSWYYYLELLKLPRSAKICTQDSLHNLKNPQDFSLIIIDESHNFAIKTSQRFERLQQICKSSTAKKKVILLSATPQKNSPNDILNQLLLFNDDRDLNVENIASIREFFTPLIAKFKDIKQALKKSQDIKDENKRQREIATQKQRLKDLSQFIREKLLRFIMLRRTRGDIESIYGKDLDKQNIHFPKVDKPIDLHYELDENARILALKTLDILQGVESDLITQAITQSPKALGYYRYLIYINLTPSGQEKYRKSYANFDDKKIRNSNAQLKVLMKIFLFKRFESSVKAFIDSIKTQISSHKALLTMFENGEIYIPKYFNDLPKFYEMVLENDDEVLDEFIESKRDKFIHLKPSDFVDGYKESVEADLRILQDLLDKWQTQYNTPSKDTKLIKLKSILKTLLKDNSNTKILIFTESKASAIYLQDNLKDSFKTLQIDSLNRAKHEKTIQENFDANYQKDLQKDDYDILISTETLAEGVNLHRAHIVINYDSPWSATRLMQRIGRANRIGATHSHIEIYNFKPSNLGNKALENFNAQIYQKLQSFHYTFGEDNQVYDEAEELDTYKLFEALQEQDSELSDETEFIKDLKDLYENDRDEFERIRKLPLKSRSFIAGNDISLIYLKQSKMTNSNQNSFFYEVGTKNALNSLNKSSQVEPNLLEFERVVQESSFLKMASFLKAHKNSATLDISKTQKAQHYDDINEVLEKHKQNLQANMSQNVALPTSPTSQNPATKKAIVKITNHPNISNTHKEVLLEWLKNNRFAKLAKEINDPKSDIKQIIAKYKVDSFIDEPKQAQENTYTPPQIQLSISTFESVIKDKK